MSELDRSVQEDFPTNKANQRQHIVSNISSASTEEGEQEFLPDLGISIHGLLKCHFPVGVEASGGINTGRGREERDYEEVDNRSCLEKQVSFKFRGGEIGKPVFQSWFGGVRTFHDFIFADGTVFIEDFRCYNLS